MRTTMIFTSFYLISTILSLGYAFAPQRQPTRLSYDKRSSTAIADSFIEDSILTSMPSFKNMHEPSTIKANKTSVHTVNNRHSSKDWIHNVASLPRSSVLREIRNPVISIAAWSTVLSIAHRLMRASSSSFWKHCAMNMCVPTSVHSFLVSSLGLLLVFRTNSAYQRFVVSPQVLFSDM